MATEKNEKTDQKAQPATETQTPPVEQPKKGVPGAYTSPEEAQKMAEEEKK